MDLAFHLARARAKLESLRPDPRLVELADRLRDAEALEIGGPSAIFCETGRVPVYPRLRVLDGCNFAARTIWSDPDPDPDPDPDADPDPDPGPDRDPDAGPEPEPDPDARPARAAPPHRSRLICEAGALTSVPDDRYDAVLASHVIEHIADPIGALREWGRVTKPGGHLLLVVPHRAGTFDHRRPITTIGHLRADAAAAMPESDLTHLEEILALHDFARDLAGCGPAEFAARSRANVGVRALHHHVFDTRSVAAMCREAGFGVTALAVRRPFHIICLARIGNGTPGEDDHVVLAALDESPFAADQATP